MYLSFLQAIATAVIALGLAVTASVGPEKKGIAFETVAPATATDEARATAGQGTWHEDVKEDDASIEKKSLDYKPEVRNHVA